MRGRPRDEQVHKAILSAALEEVSELGFRAAGVEGIAIRAGVGKTTIYRRWPNKAAVVMDAFLAQLGQDTAFPETQRAIDSMRLQLKAQAKAFRGKYGSLVRALLGEAQFDPELAKAFAERWRMPRRRVATEMLQRAIQDGDIRPDIDIDVVIDTLYAPLYYRLQIKSGPLSDEFANRVFEQVLSGIRKHGSK
jgi:AcrR family transcriptional regulator